MKAAKTVLLLVLLAAVGSAFADDGGATGPPKAVKPADDGGTGGGPPKAVKPADDGGTGGGRPARVTPKQIPAAVPPVHRAGHGR